MANEIQQEPELLRGANSLVTETAEISKERLVPISRLCQNTANRQHPEHLSAQELAQTLAKLERSNLQLANAKESAERANQTKTRFLAAASHDVLQPLNAALLLMSTLSAQQSDQTGKRLCRQVESSLETMDTLLRDLLYMSRLDAGEVKPQLQSVSLDHLLASVVSDFAPVAELRQLELRVRYRGLHVFSDPTMLRRTIQNIVANAIRYTQSGGLLVTAAQHGEQIKIRVADTGIGIPRENLSNVFVEFQRCTGSQDYTDGSTAGMGLGLAIVQRMVKTLNHKLTISSRVGHGTCFSLILPSAEALPTTHSSTIAPIEQTMCNVLANAKVLVIENDLAALQAMEALLGQWGCELRLASSTKEAMRALSGASAWTPELIIADLHLNDNERGTSAVRVLRQLVGRQIPTLIVTADSTDRLCKLADQDQFEIMQKPIKPAQLRALLAHLLTPTELVNAHCV